MTKKPIRLTDIARIARVHETTVSLALRDSLNIAEATRLRIKAIAEKLGYQSNPAFQALARYSKDVDFQNPLVLYLTDRPLQEEDRCGFSQQPYFRGASLTLSRAGFTLQPLIYQSESAFQAKLAEPGVAGMILGSIREHSGFLECFDRTKILSVQIGGSASGSGTPAVLEDTTAILTTAMAQAKATGAKRIGFVLPSSYDEFAGGEWHVAYLRAQIEARENARLPALQLFRQASQTVRGLDDEQGRHLSLLRAWVNRWKPDCIIGFTVRTKLDLERLGLRIPNDVGYIHIFANPGCASSAGSLDHREIVGEVAAEFLVRAIRQHREPPLLATKTFVSSHWQDGHSLGKKPAELAVAIPAGRDSAVSIPIELFPV